MSLQCRIAFVVLWVVSVVAVAAFVSAQQQRDPAPIISGGNIGFRPHGWNGRARTGTFLVRIDGEWVEAQGTIRPVPASQ